MISKRLRDFGFGFAFCVARSAEAYRPFDGTDADTAKNGEAELEIGPVGVLQQGSASYVFAPTFVGNLGFFPRWELVVEGQGFVAISGGDPRLVNTGIFLKHVLREGTLQEKTGISMAGELGMLLPTVNDAPGSGVYLGFIASYAWREVTLHMNFELQRARDGLGEEFVGAIFEGSSRHRVRPVAELYVDTHAGTTVLSALIGMIIRGNEHFSFDLATRFAAVADTPAFELRAGLTWAFPVWH